MPELTVERCQACDAGTPPLAEAEIGRLAEGIADAWSVEGGSVLRRSIRFRNFSAAFAMATRVAMLAEAEGHHPELTVGWGHVDIELTTHSIGGLSRNDFIMAAKIDALSP